MSVLSATRPTPCLIPKAFVRKPQGKTDTRASIHIAREEVAVSGAAKRP